MAPALLPIRPPIRPPARIGLFGGTFDPVHLGHLAVARTALSELHLDWVIFIPSGIPPSPRKPQPIAAAGNRVAMLEAALASEPRFSISTFETGRPQISYTYETVRHLAANHPPDTLFFFLMGDDCAGKVSHWIGIDEMRERVHFVAVTRGETVAPTSSWLMRLAMPPCALSSSHIRDRLASGFEVGPSLPPGVLDVITNKGLYGAKLLECVDE